MAPHRTINELRELLVGWRAAGWPGVTSRIRRLLEHWSSPGSEFRPFRCQLEAAETVIRLLEAGPVAAAAECATIRKRIRAANAKEADLDEVFAPELPGLDREAIRDWYIRLRLPG